MKGRVRIATTVRCTECDRPSQNAGPAPYVCPWCRRRAIERGAPDPAQTALPVGAPPVLPLTRSRSAGGLVVTIDHVERGAHAPSGRIVRMHIRCGGCGEYAPGDTYAESPDDQFTAKRVKGAAREADFDHLGGGRWECRACREAPAASTDRPAAPPQQPLPFHTDQEPPR